MALTSHQQIRIESGFQSRFNRQAFRNSTGASVNTFYVDTDDNVKIVPEFYTGNTIAGISDVQVFVGLSGIFGTSRMIVTAVDIDQGAITLNTIPATGVSLTVTYSSSALTSGDIEKVRLQAEAVINQRLSLCYTLPITPVPSVLDSMASRLAAAYLLIRGYGVGSRKDLSSDGYALYNILMGDGQMNEANPTIKGAGEIGMICTPNWQLPDDTGNIITRNDTTTNGDATFVLGGRVNGSMYDITEEAFRYKDWQRNVNRNQAGSGVYPNSTAQTPWL